MAHGERKRSGGVRRVAVRVLLVDDTEHVREMLAQMLLLDGFDVVGKAPSGAEAIAMVQTCDPDIVIMDYKMPSMDGITATRLIRSTAPTLPVILYTAYLDDDLERQARAAGVSACLGKIEGLASLERAITALCLELVDR